MTALLNLSKNRDPYNDGQAISSVTLKALQSENLTEIYVVVNHCIRMNKQ